MNAATRRVGALLSIKGQARPLAEPRIRLPRAPKGRRVGACLPIELYIRFKAHVARHGVTGEEAIIGAIEAALAEKGATDDQA